ncbi:MULTISPECIES: hypothetical protein [Kribbella]|nr:MULTISPECIES: hypothetical protein [Kribbella]
MESWDDAEKSFAELENFSDALEIPSHQIILGRRGTGKTHALMNMASKLKRAGDLVIFIDMRQLGSTGGIYGDPRLPISRRGTQLLADIFERVNEVLWHAAVEDPDDRFGGLLNLLDPLTDAAASVEVIGDVEREVSKTVADSEDSTSNFGIELPRPAVKLQKTSTKKRSQSGSSKSIVRGSARPHIVFGSLASAWGALAAELGPRRAWIIIDEWATVPVDLQPILADLLRRAIFPLRNVVVKIAATEAASVFEERFEQGGYLGIDLSADVSSVLNLDDHLASMLKGQGRTEGFIAEMILRHIGISDRAAIDQNFNMADAANRLRNIAFAGQDSFDEFTISFEGVPRDALNILSSAALRAGSSPLGVRHLRGAARDYYLTSKTGKNLPSPSRKVLTTILNEVLGMRRSRFFYLRQDGDATDPRIMELYEHRVLHRLVKGISESENPGILYDGFAIDHGCYIAAVGDEFIHLLRDPLAGVPKTAVDLTGDLKVQIFRLPR